MLTVKKSDPSILRDKLFQKIGFLPFSEPSTGYWVPTQAPETTTSYQIVKEQAFEAKVFAAAKTFASKGCVPRIWGRSSGFHQTWL
ncbi:MAG: hypothetical protein ABFS56_25200 [Pseudomonadota bacterium]